MIIYFLDGSTMGVRVDPENLYVTYRMALMGNIRVMIGLPLDKKAKRDIRDVDAHRTFQEVIEENFPSIPAPPSIPREFAPDTERNRVRDIGDEDGSYWVSRGSTMPCRER